MIQEKNDLSQILSKTLSYLVYGKNGIQQIIQLEFLEVYKFNQKYFTLPDLMNHDSINYKIIDDDDDDNDDFYGANQLKQKLHILNDLTKSSKPTELHYKALSQVYLATIDLFGIETQCNMASSFSLLDSIFKDYSQLPSIQASARYYMGVIQSYKQHRLYNLDEAIKSFELAAKEGLVLAQNKLGIIYFQRTQLLQYEKDQQHLQEQAFELFKKSSEQNNAKGQLLLGTCYYQGVGTNKNTQEALEQFRLSAKQGNQQANYNLQSLQKNLLDKEIQKSNELELRVPPQTEVHMKFEESKQQLVIEKEVEFNMEKNNSQQFAQITSKNQEGFRTYNEGITQWKKKNYKEALKYFVEAASMGLREALNSLGLFYQHGIEVEQNYKQAFRFFKMSADKNLAIAQYNVGNCYLLGIGISKNVRLAIQYFKMSAKQDNSFGQFALAVCYQKGNGFKKNNEKAWNYFQKSAGMNKNINQFASFQNPKKQNNNETMTQEQEKIYINMAKKDYAPIQSMLSKYYIKQQRLDEQFTQELRLANLGNRMKQFLIGTDQIPVQQNQLDEKQKLQYLKMSAGQGQKQALYKFSQEFQNNAVMHIKYLRLSSEQGYIVAIEQMARIQKQLLKLPIKITSKINQPIQVQYRNFLQFQKLLEKADNGNLDSQFQVATSYYVGQNVNSDHTKAFQYYEKSALSNYELSYLPLAKFYQAGIEVPENSEKAFYWFKKSADLGCAEAQYFVGVCYFDNLGVQQDFNKAFEYFSKSAKQGYCKGFSGIARCYQYGLGVEKIFLLTKENYFISAILGYFVARQWINHYVNYQSNIFKSNKILRYLYKLFLEKNNPECDYILGNLFQVRIQGYYNETTAIQYLEKSTQYNYAKASGELGYLYYSNSDKYKSFVLFEKSLSGGNYSQLVTFGDLYAKGTQDKKVLKKIYKAIKIFKIGNNEGEVDSILKLGLAYSKGKGVEKDLNKAFYLFNKIYRYKNKKGLQKLANCYKNGLGTCKDFSMAFQIEYKLNLTYLNQKFYEMGLYYEKGIQTKVNLRKAFNYYQKGLVQNYWLCYWKVGKFIEKNYTEFKSQDNIWDYCYSKIKSSYMSDFVCGHCKEFGIGSEKNLEQAFQYYSQSATCNYPKGEFNLARCYQFGIGTVVDQNQAFEHYKKSLRSRYTKANYQIGLCYEQGIGTIPDYEEAKKSYKDLSKTDPDKGNYILGNRYAEGKIVRKNYKIAFEYYQKSIHSRKSLGLDELCKLYQDGLGIIKRNREMEQKLLALKYKVNLLYRINYK